MQISESNPFKPRTANLKKDPADKLESQPGVGPEQAIGAPVDAVSNLVGLTRLIETAREGLVAATTGSFTVAARRTYGDRTERPHRFPFSDGPNGQDYRIIGFFPPLPGSYRPFADWHSPGKNYSLVDTYSRHTGVDLLVEPYNQMQAIDPETGLVGAQQSCGTTSLAMILNHFKPGVTDQATIDQQIRRANNGSFTSPADIVEVARGNGFRAEMKNNASVEDLTAMLDQGVPVQVIMEPMANDKGVNGPDAQDMGIHYVAVNGYERDPSGKLSSIIISDPWGMHYKMPVDEFSRRWGNQRLKGLPSGLSHFMITMVPKDGQIKKPGTPPTMIDANSIKLPTTTSMADPMWGSVGASKGFMDVRNAVAGPQGFVNLPARIGLGLAGFFGILGGLSKRLYDPIPVVGPFLGSLLQTGFNALGTAARWTGEAVTNTAKAIGAGAAAVGNAIASGVGAIGNAIGNVFKGWW